MRPLVTCVVAAWIVSSGCAPARPAVKLIEFGWDEPDPAFMRRHIDQLLDSPFDGCVFHIDVTPSTDKSGSFTWNCWGRRAFAMNDLAPALADLKATGFGRFSSNFLRFNVTPGDVDWFDDFSAVINNARLAALVAREGGARGILFDIEQYQKPLFTFVRDARPNRSFEDYSRQVRRRGAEVMAAFQAGYPDLTVFLTFGYSLPWEQMHGDKRGLVDVEYGLLAPFLDGMVEAAAGKTRMVEGNEHAYGYRHPEQFARAATLYRSGMRSLVADAGKYRRVMSMSFGLWLDYDWRKHGWSENNPASNPVPPDHFESLVRAAIHHADEYVWIYTETPRWWSEHGPLKLPQDYVDVLRRIRTLTPEKPPATAIGR